MHKKKLVTILIVLLLLVAGILVNYSLSSKKITSKESLSYRNEYYEKKYDVLKKLSVDVQVDYLERLVGKPIIVNYTQDRKYKELIYIDDSYFLQVFTNLDNKVLSFAVTTRDKNFHPQMTFTPSENLTLGKDTFNDMGITKPLACYGFMGNTSSSYYFELFEFGRAGNYLSYLIGINDSGYVKDNVLQGSSLIAESKVIEDGIHSIDCATVPQEARNSVYNTFIISKFPPRKYPGSFGVDRNSIISLPGN
jgi:hypothetical protein